MPSARLKDAPVGQTSTQGGSSQCWHISGRDTDRSLDSSTSSTLRIHCGSSGFLPVLASACSSSQADTQARQSVAHRLASTRSPQRGHLHLSPARGLQVLRPAQSPGGQRPHQFHRGNDAVVCCLQGPSSLFHHIIRHRSMATETIDLNRRVGMTAAAELSRCIYRNVGTIICLGCMTVHTAH